MNPLAFITPSELSALATVILTDVVLAGDNALVVGMAAAGLPPELRRRAIVAGLIGATLLRLLFAVVTSELLNIVGLLLAGGLLLLWVAWKLFRELRQGGEEIQGEAALEGRNIRRYRPKRFREAVLQIILADVSMSLDNVLAVSGAARGHTWVLMAGLALSVTLMGLGATLMARLLVRHRWIAYIGLLVILYIALLMIWDGAAQVRAAV